MDVKQPTNFAEQIEKMQSRGCTIDDVQFCIKVLSNVNYYRFTAYFLSFRNEDRETYRLGTNFSQVYRIYEFDRELRNLMMSAIEEIEIALRSKIAYFHAHKYGALGYENPENFNDCHNHKAFIDHFTAEVSHSSDVSFVKHHIDRYDGKMPIWAAIELFSIGMLSKFYADMKRSDQRELAKLMFSATDKITRSWLRCCTDIRNICAHYGRLYFRLLGAIPATPDNLGFRYDRKVFSSIHMLKHMHPDSNKWNNEFVIRLVALVNEYENSISLKHIGFPANWEDMLKK